MTKPDRHDAAELGTLIKKALRQEYARIDAPPSEKMWERIRAGLEEASTAQPPSVRPYLRRFLPRIRQAAVVAAALVLAAGGFALVRSQFSFSLGSREQADLAAESEIAIPLFEQNDTLSGSGDRAVPEEHNGEAGRAGDQGANGSWPVVIGQTYLFEGADTVYGPAAPAVEEYAVYAARDCGSKFFYMKLEPALFDRERLLEEMPAIMEAPVTSVEEENGTVVFRAENGSLGLSWVAGNRIMLLVDPNGGLTVEQLHKIRLFLTE